VNLMTGFLHSRSIVVSRRERTLHRQPKKGRETIAVNTRGLHCL
jgi:hypothetical protein